MKKEAINKTEEVDAYMEKLDHPLKAEIEAVRAIIKNASPSIAEHIKWAAPSFFCPGGKDKGGFATFNHRATQHVHLVLHNGAILNDTSGFLEGDYIDRRMMYFKNLEEIALKKEALVNAVKSWVALHS